MANYFAYCQDVSPGRTGLVVGILGTLYGSDAMRGVFAETAYFQRMLDTEAALARVQAQLGIIPADAADTIVAAAKVENLSTEALAASPCATCATF